MDPGPGPSDPFRRSSKVARSPQRSLSVSDIPQDSSEVELVTVVGSKKRKRASPPSVLSKKKPQGEEVEEIEDSEAGAMVFKSSGSGGDFRGMINRIKFLINDLIRWGNSQYKSKKLVNLQLTEMKTRLTDMTEMVESVEKEAYYMAGRLEERSCIEKAIGQGATGGPGRPLSFAEMAKTPKMRKVTGVQKVLAPKVIFVKSEDDTQDIDEVKDVIKKSVRPGKLGINIRRVVKTARGVMVEAESA